MSRTVKEWVGKTDDSQPPASCKARIIQRQAGVCGCGCGVKLGMAGEGIDFDHTQALILGGENRESNLRALRRPCHKVKTKADVAQKATEARQAQQCARDQTQISPTDTGQQGKRLETEGRRWMGTPLMETLRRQFEAGVFEEN